MTEPWHNHLQWALSWPWPARLAIALLAAAVLGLTWLNVQQASSPRRRLMLIGLRALTVISLLVVLAQPTWVSVVPRSGSSRVAVIVDRSASMVVGKPDKRRWDRAMSAIKSLASDAKVELYTMGETLEPVRGAAGLLGRTPDSSTTDLSAALAGLADLHHGTPLRAVAVVSDGLDNAGLRARNPAGVTSLDADTAALLRALRAPVHAIYIEDPEPVRDIAVTAVKVSSFGYTRTFVPVAVDLEISGMADTAGTLTLQLSDNGKPMVTQQVPIAGPTRRTVDMEFQPLHVGTHVLEAHAVALPQEATDANNRAWVGLRVIRDRTRILHLAGHPSWDTRFLRTHLHGDAAVDLVSFYVMVGQGAGAFVSAEDTTLIPFPAKEIFEDSLSGFDLVVLQDFPFGPFQLEQYLPQLSQYVRGGGALLVIGGPQSLAAGGYTGTGLADLLPVQFQGSPEDGGWTEAGSQPVLTPVGAAHPASLLGKDPSDNAEIWASHRLTGRNTGLQARTGSHVLVTDGGGNPLLVVGDAGEGRSALLATDSLWMWAFGAEGVAVDGAFERQRGHYHRLLDQLFAWLLRDPDLDLLRMEAPADTVAAGQPFSVRVTARDGAGVPKQVSVRWSTRPLADATNAKTPSREAPSKTDVRGETVIVGDPLPAGSYLLVAEAEIDGRTHTASAPLVVAAAVPEASQLQPSDRLLQLIAKASGGVVFAGSPPPAGLPEPPPNLSDPLALSDKVHDDLWSRPEVLVWLVALLSVEWWLRRRWGLA